MKNKKNIILLICLIVFQIQAQQKLMDSIKSMDHFLELANKSNWKTYKEKKDVSLKYRWLELNDTIKTRQICVSFKSGKKLNELIELVKNPSLITQWNSSIRKQQLFDNSQTSWVSHAVFDIPYPFKQQDLVLNNTISINNNRASIQSNSIPHFIQKLDAVKRQQFYVSRWDFVLGDSDVIDVEFSAISLTKSLIPRFIRDPIILNKLLNSFIDLKQYKKTTYLVKVQP